MPARLETSPAGRLIELDVLGDGLDELLAVADAHAQLGQDDAQVLLALGQPQGGDEHRALGDVLALHKRFLYLD